jgi:peptidoglycan hydrolase-like protein with peptidoglycan-binding domain
LMRLQFTWLPVARPSWNGCPALEQINGIIMTSDIGFGATGNEVVALQRLLNHHLSPPMGPLKVDGVFGPKTSARVIEFQALNRRNARRRPVRRRRARPPLGSAPPADQVVVGDAVDPLSTRTGLTFTLRPRVCTGRKRASPRSGS